MRIKAKPIAQLTKTERERAERIIRRVERGEVDLSRAGYDEAKAIFYDALNALRLMPRNHRSREKVNRVYKAAYRSLGKAASKRVRNTKKKPVLLGNRVYSEQKWGR